jgi:hypothetical protein
LTTTTAPIGFVVVVAAVSQWELVSPRVHDALDRAHIMAEGIKQTLEREGCT